MITNQYSRILLLGVFTCYKNIMSNGGRNHAFSLDMEGLQSQVTNNNVRAEIQVEMEHDHYQRHHEPPPPYTRIDPANNLSVIEQPTVNQTIILQPQFKAEPIYFCCPSCHKRGLTTVQFVNSHKTHMIAGFLCGLTLFTSFNKVTFCFSWCMLCCLAAIPYLVPKFKKADHYCSNCSYYLGSYSKL